MPIVLAFLIGMVICHEGNLLIHVQKSKLHPRTEAIARLQYARILFEETENDAEAEAALSKGVSQLPEPVSRVVPTPANVSFRLIYVKEYVLSFSSGCLSLES
jgi:hypothetical protein